MCNLRNWTLREERRASSRTRLATDLSNPPSKFPLMRMKRNEEEREKEEKEALSVRTAPLSETSFKVTVLHRAPSREHLRFFTAIASDKQRAPVKKHCRIRSTKQTDLILEVDLVRECTWFWVHSLKDWKCKSATTLVPEHAWGVFNLTDIGRRRRKYV